MLFDMTYKQNTKTNIRNRLHYLLITFAKSFCVAAAAGEWCQYFCNQISLATRKWHGKSHFDGLDDTVTSIYRFCFM